MQWKEKNIHAGKSTFDGIPLFKINNSVSLAAELIFSNVNILQ